MCISHQCQPKKRGAPHDDAAAVLSKNLDPSSSPQDPFVGSRQQSVTCGWSDVCKGVSGGRCGSSRVHKCEELVKADRVQGCRPENMTVWQEKREQIVLLPLPRPSQRTNGNLSILPSFFEGSSVSLGLPDYPYPPESFTLGRMRGPPTTALPRWLCRVLSRECPQACPCARWCRRRLFAVTL